MHAFVWKCRRITFINITFIEIKKLKKSVIWTRMESRWRLLAFNVKIARSKNPFNNTLVFTQVLRRELWAWMKRREKEEFTACASRNSFKKLNLSNNLGKIKNVCNCFPKLIQAFFINSSKATLSELLSDPGRNWCRFDFLNPRHNYVIEMGNSSFCPYHPSLRQKQHRFADKKSVVLQTHSTGVKTRTFVRRYPPNLEIFEKKIYRRKWTGFGLGRGDAVKWSPEPIE